MTVNETLASDVERRWRDSLDLVASTVASMPSRGFDMPLPNRPGFDRVHGRAGDLLVVQIASHINASEERKAAIRTLGLSGPHSAALQMSASSAMWGNVRFVRDLVAVYPLAEVYYKESRVEIEGTTVSEVESFKYGSGKKPAEMWRGNDGSYFAYEIGKRASCIAFWSTPLSFESFLQRVASVGFEPEKSSEGYLALRDPHPESPDAIIHRSGLWSEIFPNSLPIVRASVRIDAYHTLKWQAPFARFHDREDIIGSAGISSSPVDVAVTRAMVSATGPRELIDSGVCHIRAQNKGKYREYKL